MLDDVADAQIATLPEPARTKALRWLADGRVWGWKLHRLDIDCVDDRVHVAMHFNIGDVDFVAKTEGR
jgi:hypothetical protein